MSGLNLPDWAKLTSMKASHLLAFWVACGAVFVLPLLLPEDHKAYEAVSSGWVTTPFMFGCLFGFMLWLAKAAESVAEHISKARSVRRVVARLDGLSFEERLVLSWCASRGQRTVYLDLRSPIARGLIWRGFLERPAGESSGTKDLFHEIPLALWPHIQERKTTLLLKNEQESPLTEQMYRELDSRPGKREGFPGYAQVF